MTAQPRRGLGRFLVVWAGQLISLIGSGLTSFALAVWTFQATSEVLPFALTVLLGTLPKVLLAPVVGVVADRWNRRTILVLADSGSALVTVAALLLYANGQLTLGSVYLFALAGAICDAFQEPTYAAAITMLVPKEQLGRAAGLGQLSLAVEALVVPPLAGLLFVTVGMAGIFVIDLISFALAIAALLITPIPQPEPVRQDVGGREGLLADLTFGWRYLAARRGLLLLVGYFALVNMLLNSATVLTTPLVLSFGGADTLGLVQMCVGAGLLIGSIGASIWAARRRQVVVIIGSLGVAGLGLLVVGLHPSLPVVGGGFFLMMLAIPAASAASQAIFQRKVLPAAQGRVFAARSMVSQAMMPFGFLGAGLLADHVFEPLLRAGGQLAATPIGTLVGVGSGRGIGLMFLLAGLLLLLASMLALTMPRLRRLEEELPDHDEWTAPEPLTSVPIS